MPSATTAAHREHSWRVRLRLGRGRVLLRRRLEQHLRVAGLLRREQPPAERQRRAPVAQRTGIPRRPQEHLAELPPSLHEQVLGLRQERSLCGALGGRRGQGDCGELQPAVSEHGVAAVAVCLGKVKVGTEGGANQGDANNSVASAQPQVIHQHWE